MDREYDVISAVLGLVVGDALGVPVEFTSRKERIKNPVTDMRAYGTHSQPKGTWSDDSSMVVATLEWYEENRGHSNNYEALMDKFCEWRIKGEYTPYNACFDIGITVSNALENYRRGIEPLKAGETGEYANGNGSLMRILPTALYFARDYDGESIVGAKEIYEMSSLTHGHARSKLACLIYSRLIGEILHHGDLGKREIVEKTAKDIRTFLETKENDQEIKAEADTYKRIWNPKELSKLKSEDIKSSGYVVDTLEAALWCFLTTDSYAECVLKAVNLGDDSDTVGAVSGGIAGAYYGMNGIPEEWLEVIPKKDWIISLSKSVC